MQILRIHQRGVLALIDPRVVLFNLQRIEESVEVLHIADIATEADDGFLVEGFEAVDVGEAGEGTVRGEVVGGDDDSRAEFQGDDGGSSHDGGLRVRDGLLRAAVGVGKVGWVVAAVDVVAGLY